ncbi:hypothetical protein [Flavobacterium sp. MDT1-60]|uniref:hypothetical protein n=1 Tax=Flavobacterium sp. MDT1-60 TaxID=1979344 RepID=UPI00178548FC|nr:hypothetical protein [Flavobacterium sp. MDT1-60]QOG03601.1 hypothetical protein IHE43_05020 [Flavobacterium sp. MDT1-60]
MPVSISVNVCRCCGCKSSTFIYIYKGFYYIFSIFFISSWYGGFYNPKFFCLFQGFACLGRFYVVFATKAPGNKVWFSLFIGLCLLLKKAQSWILPCFSGSCKPGKVQSPLFSSGKRLASFKNESPSPDSSANPFAFFFKKQKIEADSGNSS